MISVRDIYKTYQMGDTQVHALRGVSLNIESGEFVAIMGPSGSGKSTLMHILGLLDVPDAGSFHLYGKEVAHLKEDELAVLRREAIGFIFQQFNLLPRITTWENVSLPLLYTERRLDFGRAKSLLEKVQLGNRLDHKSNELSGGQQQRVAIARSMINNPGMLLADEPTGNLDSVSEKEIMEILRRLNELGITVVLVTHEEEIGRQAKRLIRMRDGVIQSDERISSAAPTATHEAKDLSKSTPDQFHWGEIIEHFRQGFRSLTGNKVRTFLSMLGILIGVAAVVAMLALGQGAQKAIERQLASLGSNLLVLRPGSVRVGGVSLESGSVTKLTLDDVANLEDKIPAIQEASPTVSGRVQVTYQDKNWNTQLTGAAPAYAEMHAADPPVGRFFTDDENKQRSRVAIIGKTVARQLFENQDPIGEMIKINKVNFQVIGILPEKG
jgi:macrolide transport system ATP-binding/permease protein